MSYINDSITSITTYSVKSQGNAAIVVLIYWTHVRPVRPPAGALGSGYVTSSVEYRKWLWLTILLEINKALQ